MASIITLMKELNYPTDDKGVCVGLALRAEKARDRGKYAEFKARMDYLNDLEEGVLKGLIAKAALHKEAIKLEEEINDKNELKQLLQEAKARAKRAPLTLTAKQKRLLALESFFFKPLKAEEEILLTVESYFFQVWMYFRPSAMQEFLGLKGVVHWNQDDVSKVEEWMYDVNSIDEALKPLNLPNRYLLSATGWDNHQAIHSFLTEVQNSGVSLGLVISGGDHTVHCFYDAEQKCWRLTDHSFLESFGSIDELMNALIPELTQNDVAHLDFRVFSSEQSEEKEVLLQRLNQISEDSIAECCEHEINRVDSHGNTILHRAARCGYKDVVQRLLQRPHIQVNVKNNNGNTALHLAAANGHVDIVDVLLKHSDIQMNVNAVDKDDYTALHFAAGNGHVDIVDALLECSNIQVNAVDKNDCTALHFAAYNGYTDVVSVLLQHLGIQVNVKNNNGRTALHRAADQGHADSVRALLKHSEIEVNAVDTENYTALHLAAYNGHVDIVNALLEHSDIKVNAVDKNDCTALHLAALNGHVDIVNAFLRRTDIPVHAVNKNGRTALHLAAYHGHADSIRALLEGSDIEVNAVDNIGSTPLHLAAYYGHTDSIRVLLKHQDIQVNAVNNNGRTALHLAALNGRIEVVKFLLEQRGIQANAVDDKGNTPLSLAEKQGHTEIVKMFRAYQKSPTTKALEEMIKNYDANDITKTVQACRETSKWLKASAHLYSSKRKNIEEFYKTVQLDESKSTLGLEERYAQATAAMITFLENKYEATKKFLLKDDDLYSKKELQMGDVYVKQLYEILTSEKSHAEKWSDAKILAVNCAKVNSTMLFAPSTSSLIMKVIRNYDFSLSDDVAKFVEKMTSINQKFEEEKDKKAELAKAAGGKYFFL